MGALKSGGNESAKARRDEARRQSNIRQGTARVNAIFGGGQYGKGTVGTKAKYDPSATYYLANGKEWTPNPKSDKSAAEQFATKVSNGQLFSGVEGSAGAFGDGFYNARQKAYLDYATPQLQSQYGDAQKELTYALARSGTLDSSARASKAAELQKLYDLNKQQIGDQAIASATEARTAVEDARTNLINTLNATGDAAGAANSAIARAQALSQPAAYSPLTQLFTDFTATLGAQTARDRAAYYSGNGTGGSSSGLFTPRSNSVVVR